MFKALSRGYQLRRSKFSCILLCEISCLRTVHVCAFSSRGVNFNFSPRFCLKTLKLRNTFNISRHCLSSGDVQLGSLSRNQFEVICNETLESLSDYFEELIEHCGHLKSCDVTFSDGVLTINFGEHFGTYVINRQTPNRQIWLSSPTSGPKRFDYDPERKQWVYRHDNRSLHQLLQDEIPEVVRQRVNFFKCAYSGEKV